jgi:ATP-dependent helicase/nuclease subunit A
LNQDAGTQATLRQREAADPRVSVSLLASAGSGKTKVLVDRFLRLCVEDGSGRAEPRSILAITFTRKAAVEIQERLLSAARKLALAPDDDLRAQLAELFGRQPGQVSASEMTAAAGLYEKILEDVSALSVGTIHSFCQAILGRFAAEAGLDPHAALLENTDDLVAEALDQLEREIATDDTLAAASGEAGKDPVSVRAALRDLHNQRLRLDRWARRLQPEADPEEPLPPMRRHQLIEPMFGQVAGELFAGMDLPEGDPQTGLLEALERELTRVHGSGLDAARRGVDPDIPGKQAASLDKVVENLRQAMGDLLTVWRAVEPSGRGPLVPALKEIFLTKADKLRRFSGVKGYGEEFNNLFHGEILSLLDLLRSFGYLELMRTNRNLLLLTLRLLDICDELKRRDQVIDFQDLEDFAGRLMGDHTRAMSLLFRLEDGIQHILLDEFQDTNFNQWDILEPFVTEFLGGGSDPERPHTVFVVGDVKQSIYGFRGAEPELFGLVQKVIRHNGKDVALPTNFRSLKNVVQAVGCLFSAPPLVDALPEGASAGVKQEHFRNGSLGKVVILDPFSSPENDRDGGADDEAGPSDGPALESPGGDQLAAAAAARLARSLVEESSSLSWSDLLVLCRSRTEIAVYEKAFRDAGIPVAAAGRGTLAASREVQDVLALLRWLIYPEDDLALATVLRSPIFRLGEEEFQQALAGRGLNRVDDQGKLLPPLRLWQSIRRLKDDPRLGRAVKLLHSWRGRVGLESCHDLLRRIFREGGLPERYQAAGENQARDNLLRLYDLALAPDVASTPTVRRLVEVIDRAARLGAEEEAVTPPDQEKGRVRFMTIHGAKGLEAPVVFLVDADRKLGRRDLFVRLRAQDPSSPLLFKVDRKFREGFAGADLPASPVERAASRAAGRDLAENANLLYVAMTRARDQLYVLGGQKCTKPEHDSFLRQLTRAAEVADCQAVSRLGFNLMDGSEQPLPAVSGGQSQISESRSWTPPALTPLVRSVIPSTLEEKGGQALPPNLSEPQECRPQASLDEGDAEGQDRQGAIDRGHLVHLLLQLAADTGEAPAGDRPEAREARAVFDDLQFAWVFKPALEQGRGLSEVPVIHRLTAAGSDGAEERVTGVIDRLVLRPGRVDIIDYKTNRTGGDPQAVARLVDHYRPQLATYRDVIGVLFPELPVAAWLLFTDPDFPRGVDRLQEVT